MVKFDEIKQTTAETAEMIAGKSIQFAKIAAEKTKQFAKIAKMKAEILAEKEAMRRAYIKLGKLYYEIYGKQPDDQMKEYVGIIEESEKRIKEMQDRINEIKVEGMCGDDADIEIEIEVIPDEDCDNEDILGKTDDSNPGMKDETDLPG